jgi:hypothetical protein
MNDKTPEVYAYPLKLDGVFKEPLQALAKKNRRKINDEINLAVEWHLYNCVKFDARKKKK